MNATPTLALNTQNSGRYDLWFAAALILLAALSRLLPHPLNFAPIGALALFGGAYLRDTRWAFALPLAAVVLSDLFLGFYSTVPFVYAAYLAIVPIGRWALQSRRSIGRIFGAGLASATTFFVITNFGVWAEGALYPMTTEGLLGCYTAALPFFRNTLAGDLFYSFALFGAFELYLRRRPAAA